MSYKILLFDLDDTLLDFGANETDSLNKLAIIEMKIG
jgi:2-haloacid dehalogenase